MPPGRAQTSTLAAAERRRQAVELRRAGATYEDIARTLDVNKGTVHRWVTRAIREATDEPARELVSMERHRLDKMQAGLWGKATHGNVGAVLGVIKIMERRARLLGLDAPQRVDVGRADIDLDGAVSTLLELAQGGVITEDGDPVAIAD